MTPRTKRLVDEKMSVTDDFSESLNNHNFHKTIWDSVIFNWKIYVFAFLLIVAFAIILYGNENSIVLKKDSFGYQLINAIWISILIALFVIIGERTFEKKSIIEEIADIVAENRVDVKKDIENVFQTSVRYGMKEIQNNIDDCAIIKDPENKNIMIMNTKYNRRGNMIVSIEEAMRNGASVKLLLMHKNNECAHFRGKDSCDDHENAEHVENRKKSYLEEVSTNFDIMLDFYKRVRADSEISDRLELRFYKDIPSIPIIILEKGKRYEEAYSGFYLTRYSSGNPYIRWTSGDGDAFIDRLYEYFERKWYYASDGDAEILLDGGS